MLANGLSNILANMPKLKAALPHGLVMNTVFNNTTYIKASIYDVVKTLIEAVMIVTVVLFLFIGSIRSVIVPIVAIPLSMIGAFFLMFLMGFSINLLTLLAMVLAIGLVVDDAIVVSENIYRHVEEGMTTFKAAMDSIKTNYEYIAYLGVKHSFTSKEADENRKKFNLDALVYNADADKKSWESLQSLLKTTFNE